jgi:hypothetical protein
MSKHRHQRDESKATRPDPASVTEQEQERLAHEDIASLAYSLWLENGCRDGCAEEDWLRAEQLLREEREGSETRSAVGVTA